MKNVMRKHVGLTAAIVALGTALAVPAASAATPAATTATAKSVAVQGTAPACIKRDVIKQKKQVTVTNNCGRTMHVKVTLKHAPDMQCWTYQPGEAFVWHWKVGSYGKIVTC